MISAEISTTNTSQPSQVNEERCRPDQICWGFFGEMNCPFKTGSTWTFVSSSDLSASKVADHPVNPQAYVIVLRDTPGLWLKIPLYIYSKWSLALVVNLAVQEGWIVTL